MTLDTSDAVVWTMIIATLCFFLAATGYMWKRETTKPPRSLPREDRELFAYSFALPVLILIALVVAWVKS